MSKYYTKGTQAMKGTAEITALANEFDEVRDNVDTAFDGIEIDVDTLDSKVTTLEGKMGDGHVVTEHQTQATAVPGPILRPLLIMDRPGTLANFLVNVVTPANPMEDTTVDLLVNGGSVLAAPIMIDSAVPPFVPIPGVIVAPAVSPMDRIDVTFTYTPGGGPAPMADVSGTVWINV